MKFAALLGAIALVPITAVAGYFLHQDPSMPGFGQYITQELGLRHVPGEDSDDWLAAVVTGPMKGSAAPVTDVFQVYPSQKALETSAGGKIKYYEIRCKNYSTGGDKDLMFTSRSVIRKCSAQERTRKQVQAYVSAALRTSS